NVRCADDGVACKWQLLFWCEYSNFIIAALLRRKQESRFRKVHLARDCLHRLSVKPRAIYKDRKLVSAKSLFSKHICYDELSVSHFILRFSTLPIRLMPSSIISGS